MIIYILSSMLAVALVLPSLSAQGIEPDTSFTGKDFSVQSGGSVVLFIAYAIFMSYEKSIDVDYWNLVMIVGAGALINLCYGFYRYKVKNFMAI